LIDAGVEVEEVATCFEVEAVKFGFIDTGDGDLAAFWERGWAILEDGDIL